MKSEAEVSISSLAGVSVRRSGSSSEMSSGVSNTTCSCLASGFSTSEGAAASADPDKIIKQTKINVVGYLMSSN